MSSEKKYYENVNIVRGIAILLVVLGHGITNIYEVNGMGVLPPVPQYIFILIYSFHMPLFVFLSGFCNSRLLQLDTAQSRGAFVKKRFSRLMVPYLVWGILYVFLDIIGGNYTLQQFSVKWYALDLLEGDNANWQLWTLYALFVCVVLAIVLLTVLKLSLPLMTIVSGVIFVVYAICCEIQGLPGFLFITIIAMVLMYFFFFLLGMLVREKDWIERIERMPVSVMGILSIILLVNAFLGLYFNRQMNLATDWTKILGACTGIGFVCAIAARMKKGRIRVFFDLLGKHCMDIYVLANICQVLVRMLARKVVFLQNFHILALCLSVFCGILVPILIDRWILSRCKILRVLLLGA